MNQFLEYTANHPYLVAAAAILAILAVVIEIRHRARGSNMIAPNDAVRLVNGGALVLDVRESKDFESGHIIDARNVPGTELGSRLESFKKYQEKPVVVYCESGSASAAAARTLLAQGFSKVVTLRGGLHAWRQENLPLIKGTAKKEARV